MGLIDLAVAVTAGRWAFAAGVSGTLAAICGIVEYFYDGGVA